ncbi:MAG: DUF3592 domain-containing protein [Hydrogeniiclostridium sp.]
MKKKKRTIPIFGIIFICFGIASFSIGITGYIEQLGQRDWSVTTATVINIDEYRSGHKNRSTRYNILYQYEANGNVYTGEIVKSNTPKTLGETLEIKFDPDAPENSTQYLEPAPGFVVSGVIGFIIFGLIGYRMIRGPLLKKKKSKPKTDTLQNKRFKEKNQKMTSSSTEVMEMRQHQDRIFQEVCEMVRKLKQKHPSVGYVVRLECSDKIELDSELPNRYSAWIFVSLNRNRTILESGEDSGEWPGACDEIIRVKSFFGKNKKLIVSDTYNSSLAADLEIVTDEYEASYWAYVENKEASDEILGNACCVEWID